MTKTRILNSSNNYYVVELPGAPWRHNRLPPLVQGYTHYSLRITGTFACSLSLFARSYKKGELVL
ncbi:hypothetical protein GC101_12565 [Paenibacillus sp. LMG 31459]|uniref:Uncharacterized protein n=1 Tax=Paenibacillus phytohabitans TaxID=2654978 RepID=A0ABX1YFX6_9BACL|nr:hypothetical protein [Paenibacillus phytohabitans]